MAATLRACYDRRRRLPVNKKIKVQCPVCGYKMPVSYDGKANCEGVFTACKGRNCTVIFEIKIINGKQIK